MFASTVNWFAQLAASLLLMAAFAVAAIVFSRRDGNDSATPHDVPDDRIAPKPSPVDDDASGVCAHCGYSAHALTQFHCPECGSDLRQVGIKPPEEFPRETNAMYIIAIGIAIGGMMLLACMGYGTF